MDIHTHPLVKPSDQQFWFESRAFPAVMFEHRGEKLYIVNVDGVFPDKDREWRRPRAEVAGAVMHHDAVAYSGGDLNRNGSTFDEEMQRARAIYEYHVQQGWNGIGYHWLNGHSNRILIPRWDVLDTRRAHTSTSASSGTYRFPYPNGETRITPDPLKRTPVWNRSQLGGCLMGHYSDGRDGLGRAVDPVEDRPPQIALVAFDGMAQLAADIILSEREGGGDGLTLHPHSWFQRKPCPGSWVDVDAWPDHRYRLRTFGPTTTPDVPAEDRSLRSFEEIRAEAVNEAGDLRLAVASLVDRVADIAVRVD